MKLEIPKGLEGKMILGTDQLVWTNAMTPFIEEFCYNAVNTPMISLAHRPGAWPGSVEQRRITSSFFTTFLAKKLAGEESEKLTAWDWHRALGRYSYLIPTAAKKIQVSCNVKSVMSFSFGLGHGWSFCEDTHHLVYLLDWPDYFPFGKNQPTWQEKLFSRYLERWSLKSLLKANQIIYASPEIKERVEKRAAELLPDLSIDKKRQSERLLEQAKILIPGLKTKEFPAMTSPIFKYDYWVIHALHLSHEQASQLAQIMEELGHKFIFVGEDRHLSSLKQKLGERLFFGDRCAGELAPLLAGSRAVIDFQKAGHPQMALQSMAAGRPVVIGNGVQKDHALNLSSSILPQEGTHQLGQMNKDALEQLWQKLAPEAGGFLNGKALRQKVLIYDEDQVSLHWNQLWTELYGQL